MQGNVAPTPHLRRIGSVVTTGGIGIILFATLLPDSGASMASHFCLICGTLGGVDAILNVLLFAPLGIGLALSGLSAKRAILTMLLLSVLIETTQLLVIPGRDATLGDVVTNTLGGALGFAASRYTRIWLRPSSSKAMIFLIGWGALWFGIQTIASFAFSLSIPDSQYYGQLSPLLGGFAVFRGSVLAAGVGDIAIPNTALRNSRGLRGRLQSGASVAVTLIPSEATPGIAPIVRVADTEYREIALLAQDGVDLLFAIRSGAASLRLRPPLFALPDVFARSTAQRLTTGDTIVVGGRYSARDVRIRARSRDATYQSVIPLTASLGWTLVLPWQWYIEGTRAEREVSWIWVAALVLPFGYWAAYGTRSARTQTVGRLRISIVAVGIVVIYAGLVLTPQAFGLPAATRSEWLAAFGGMLLGGGLATRLSRTNGTRDAQ